MSRWEFNPFTGNLDRTLSYRDVVPSNRILNGEFVRIYPRSQYAVYRGIAIEGCITICEEAEMIVYT